MIELIQFPWSPFCIVQRRILEFSGVDFQVTDVPSTDRTLVWRATRQRYYQVPVLRHGKAVIFETDDRSQVIAKYLDEKLELGLFPALYSGVQQLIWPRIENEIEGLTFRLNDAYWEEFVPPAERLNYLRFKERKFGRGCLEQWRANEKDLRAQLEAELIPFDLMLARRPFLLDDRPRFLDFDLFGMLGNLLFTGHHRLPSTLTALRGWHRRMEDTRLDDFHDR